MSTPRLRRFFRHGFLPQLLAFEACIRLGSVTRAAEELSLAQPTVSGMIRKLSETIGATLVRPRNGRMEPTEAGQELERLCAEMRECLLRYEERREAREIAAAVQVRARLLEATRARARGSPSWFAIQPTGRPPGAHGTQQLRDHEGHDASGRDPGEGIA